ncbi:MAG: hypothetical protein AAGH76_01695 [Pseudomonadota bacterium]
MESNRRFGVRVLVMFMSRCSAVLLAIASAANASLNATVTVADSLARASVVLVADEPIATLYARSSAAVPLLAQLTTCEGNTSVVSRVVGRRAKLTVGTRCIRYDTSLPELRGRRGLSDSAIATARLTDPRHWLVIGSGSQAEMNIDFRMPAATVVSAPWQSRRDGGFRRPRDGDRSGTPVVVFGQFPLRDIKTPLGVLRVAYLGQHEARDHDKLFAWLAASVANVASSFDALIVSDLQVLLFDAKSHHNDSPVPFGMVTRTEAPAIRFYVDPSRSLADLTGDWTATHELAHLLMPRIKERWIGEGFATYLQHVLMASGGAWSERRVWQEMLAGFARGRAARPELSPAQASGQTGGRMKVYWAGAALALAADVELRVRSNNAMSLPSAVAAYAKTEPTDSAVSAEEYLRALDAALDTPVFMPLFESIGATPGFPDTDTLLSRLGVEQRDNAIVLNDEAELATLRHPLAQGRISGQSLQPES